MLTFRREVKVVVGRHERSAEEDLFQELKLKQTPAVVVLRKDFKVAKTFTGKIKAGPLAKALRGQARSKKTPKR